MSESNRTIVRYVKEATYGETPVDSANWKPLPINSEGLNAGPVTTQSQRIRGTDRMPADLKKVNTNVGGPAPFEFSYGDFDDLLSGVMMADWATNVLTAGLDDSVNQFTVEKEFADLTSKFIYFKGMRVASLDLAFAINDIVKGTVAFQGADGGPDATSLVGLGSVAAASGNDVFANVDMQSVTYDGVSIATSGIIITKISLKIDNKLRPNHSILASTPINQKAGTHTFSGTIEAYVDDNSWEIYQDMFNNTQVSLAWTVQDSASQGYTFNLPLIKVSGNAPAASGLDSDNMITADFLAIETPPTITRIP